MDRPDKEEYYLNIARSVSERSTCLRRQHGAVIVKNDEIVSTGYNGAPRGVVNCTDLGSCKRAEMNVPRGERYELCRSVHAEANAIISASRSELLDSTIYVVGFNVNEDGSRTETKAICCEMCKRMIINAGIRKVVVYDPEDGSTKKTMSYFPEYWVNKENAEIKGTKMSIPLTNTNKNFFDNLKFI